VRCSTCSGAAILDQPYRGRHLCATHFRRSVEERVRAELRRQLPRDRSGTLAVGLSGGKDSAVALTLTHEHLRSVPRLRLIAISVDEGIDGYRGATLAAAEALTRRLGVEHRVVRAADELGTTTDRAVDRLPGTVPCAFCGVWRRRLLNRAARDAGARGLVMGFNLDDLAQTVLMNLVHGDLDRLARMAPHRVTQPGLIPRLAPLAQVPEREVYVYARLRELPFDHGECPHAHRAARNLFREVVWQLEEAQPGTRQTLLRTHAELVRRGLLGLGAGAPGVCTVCGDPASGEVCRACEYLRLEQTAVAPAGGP
jgi:uncharacterized protein (TIGR00269 family)